MHFLYTGWHRRLVLPLIALGTLTLLPFVSRGATAGYNLVGTFPVAIKEPSGLTYDPINDSLWTVQDGGGDLFEIDKKGNVLKKVPLKSGDLEGIAYKADTDTFLLAEERRREIVEIDRRGKTLETVKVPIEWHYWNLNYGIEGIAFEPRSKGIFVANEKKPCRIIEMEQDGRIVQVFDVDKVSDISGLHYDATSDRLLVLSHESKSVLELNRMGQFVRSFPIEAAKAEGITKDNKGYLYILCEATSTLYVYAPEVVPTMFRGQ